MTRWRVDAFTTFEISKFHVPSRNRWEIWLRSNVERIFREKICFQRFRKFFILRLYKFGDILIGLRFRILPHDSLLSYLDWNMCTLCKFDLYFLSQKCVKIYVTLTLFGTLHVPNRIILCALTHTSMTLLLYWNIAFIVNFLTTLFFYLLQVSVLLMIL